MLAPNDAEPISGWVGINTHFGDVSEPFREYAAYRFVQQQADISSAHVLIFPEFVVPCWSEATEVFWRRTVDQCRRRGQILAIGAGLQSTKAGGVESADRKPFRFDASIKALQSTPESQGGGTHEHLRSVELAEGRQAPTDNTLQTLGAESGTFYQRVPVPIGMWRPFSEVSIRLRLGAPGTFEIDHQRAAVLICYEQMLTFPILESLLQHPTVIVGISNTFWFNETAVPRHQASALRSWARLFHLPLFLAVNS